MIILFLSGLSSTSFLGSLCFFSPARVRKTGADFSGTGGETPLLNIHAIQLLVSRRFELLHCFYIYLDHLKTSIADSGKDLT